MSLSGCDMLNRNNPLLVDIKNESGSLEWVKRTLLRPQPRISDSGAVPMDLA